MKMPDTTKRVLYIMSVIGKTEVYDSLWENERFQHILKGTNIYEMSGEILKFYTSESGMMQFKRHID